MERYLNILRNHLLFQRIMLLNNYMRQHAKVREAVIKINDLYKVDLKENAFEIVTQINRLAGVLKDHLDGEKTFGEEWKTIVNALENCMDREEKGTQ